MCALSRTPATSCFAPYTHNLFKTLQEFFFDTFIKNPTWGILVSVIGWLNFLGEPARFSGILFGIGIGMIAASIRHHYLSWKDRREARQHSDKKSN